MKSRFKKVISGVLVIVMTAAVLSGCSGSKEQNNQAGTTNPENTLVNKTGLPIVKQPTTFSILVQKNVSDKTTWAEKEAVKKAEAETGMKFEWTEIQPQAWKEKVSVTLATGTLPDGVIGEMQDLPIFLDSFLPLDNLIKEYAPNVTKFFTDSPETKVACTQGDGKIYSLPLAQYNGWTAAYALSINKTWLTKLNLKMPTTLDELYQVLKSFKENDPNGNGKKDEIPFGFYLDNSAASRPYFYHMLWNFGLVNDGIGMEQHFVMVENGKVNFIGADKRFYDYLKYMNKLHKEGLIDADGFIQKYQDYISKGQKGLYGLISHQTYDDIVVGLNNSKDYEAIIPMKDTTGKTTIVPFKVNGNLVPTQFKITKDCKNPEALVRLYDYANSSFENKLLWSFGPENVVVNKAENGKYNRVTQMPQGINNFAELRQTMSPGMAGFWFLTTEDNARFNAADAREKKLIGRIDLYKPFYKKELIPYGQDTAEATQERAVMYNEINSYMMNFMSDSTLKNIDDAKWNAHLDNLKKLNIEKFVKDYQAYYDRSMAAMNKK